MVRQSHDIGDELGSVDTKRKDLRNKLRAMTSGCRDQDKQQKKPWRSSCDTGKPREGGVNRSSEEMVSKRLPVVLGIKSKYG